MPEYTGKEDCGDDEDYDDGDDYANELSKICKVELHMPNQFCHLSMNFISFFFRWSALFWNKWCLEFPIKVPLFLFSITQG